MFIVYWVYYITGSKDKSMETPQSSNVNLVARPSQQLLEQGLCPQLQFERACLRGID